MANFKRLLFIIILSVCSVAGYSSSETFSDKIPHAKVQEETMSILVTINSEYFVRMKDIPTTGYLEVYTILGERIKRLDLNKCKEGATLDLSKGLYILRAGKITQKIVVR